MARRSTAICTPPAIEVRRMRGALGRGVFAARDFTQGETVEVSPCLIVRQKNRRIPGGIASYVFECQGGYALALGYGSLYNHSYDPNLSAQIEEQKELLHFIARRSIAAGEELRINYAGLGSTDKVWFEVLN